MVLLSISSLLPHGVWLIPFYLTLTFAQEAPCPKDDFYWDSVRFPSFCRQGILTLSLCRSPQAIVPTGPLVMKNICVRG